MNDLGVLPRSDVLVESDRIAAIGTDLATPAGASVLYAAGRVLMPAFVDCHTHACWAGDRLDEWDRKRSGAAYLDILRAGGGIMSTVRAVRAASEDQLAADLLGRLRLALAHGTTTIEVKSGYGLDTETELKMLRAIARAARDWPGTVIPTACIGHAIDPNADPAAFLERTIHETLPAVHAEFPGVAIDAYCETGAWPLDACERLFDAARTLGHPCRVHADQFHALGMVDSAIDRAFVSVDHLEATDQAGLERLAASPTFGVMLPCSGFHTDARYANGRRFVDAGGALAIATNWNPGSAPCGSVAMAVALAVRNNGLTPAEAITACTANAATLLGLNDRGSIEPGNRADLVLLHHRDDRELAHHFGLNPVAATICGGRLMAGGA